MPSVMQCIGTPNGRHNKDIKYRSHLENVDPKLSRYNEILNEKPIEEIYQEHLQPAFDEYNAKQKRKDRRLDVKWGCTTALEYQRAMDVKARASKNKIDQKGRPPIREIVWQIGNPQQGFGCKDQTEESRALAKTLLTECLERAKERYPNFVWGDEVFHADEVSESADGQAHGSFHLHTAFVPLCYQNKQGPSVQVAMERCLKEMGFDTFQAWKHDLDALMEGVLKEHGLERTVMDNHEKHQNATEFHRQQRLIKETNELQREKDVLVNEIEQAEERLQEISDWPAYESEANRAWNILESFRKLMQDVFNSGWIFRNRKAEAGLLSAMESVRDLIRDSINYLRGFERNFQVPEEHQRSKVIGKSLDATLKEAAAKVNPSAPKRIKEKEQER